MLNIKAVSLYYVTGLMIYLRFTLVHNSALYIPDCKSALGASVLELLLL